VLEGAEFLLPPKWLRPNNIPDGIRLASSVAAATMWRVAYRIQATRPHVSLMTGITRVI
jgi:hypothetical protein